jgi:DNA polymerase-3 subunit chi
MGKVVFYHLTRSTAEAVIDRLIPRAQERGWRIVLRGTDARALDRLDLRLWTADEASFLPHGVAGGPHDADQPILLTTGPDRPNGAAFVIAIDGAAVPSDEAAALEQACILFDGADADAVAGARSQWTALTAAGLPAQYWSEASGRWVMERETGALP